MKVYRGKSDGGHKTVTVNRQPLATLYASNERRNVPFDWGIESPGARHLAGALLADCTGAKSEPPLANDFAIEVVSKLPTDWEITSEMIEKWLRNRYWIGESVQQASWAPSTFAERAPVMTTCVVGFG